METPLDIEHAWGGFYASTDPESGRITVFRLLDLNRDAYHAALFPFMGYAPIDARGMVILKNLRFLGSRTFRVKDWKAMPTTLKPLRRPPTTS